MKGQRQLDGAEIRGQVASSLCDRLDDRVTAFRRELSHFSVAQGVEIPWRINSVKNGQESPH
jgi:hypothetical protein